MSDDQTPERQHALTPAQRFHLEVNGYVVVEDVLGADEISRMLEAMQRLKCEFLASDDLTYTTIRRSSVKSDSQPHHLHFTVYSRRTQPSWSTWRIRVLWRWQRNLQGVRCAWKSPRP